MTIDELLAPFSPTEQALLRPLVRTTQIPVTGPVREGPHDQLGGAPWLPAGTTHPDCACCGEPLALFVQLRTDPLLKAFPGLPAGKLVQLFYCINGDGPCEVDGEAWMPFNGCTQGHLVDASASGRMGKALLPGKGIHGWRPAFDLPHPEDIPPEIDAKLEDLPWEPLWEANHEGDKLGGWPKWVQGPELPDCPECGQQCRFLFQVDSECGVDWMFGDAGIAHLSYCVAHPHQLGFGWACS